MLSYIHIKNFAIIQDLEIDFQDSMTCLTGETGAGKSIIIDSLELALGARADISLVRNNSERAEITVTFELNTVANVRDWLRQHELDSGNKCIIRRIITTDGRSKSSINGNPCTQQTLRTIGELLLSIHGQHEHQNLLNPDYQRQLLDAFGTATELCNKVKNLYATWLKTKKELLELENLAKDHTRKVDFLNYQIQELEVIDLNASNIVNLHNEQKRLQGTTQFAHGITQTLNLLQENEETTIISGLYTVQQQLETCKNINDNIQPALDLVNNAILQLEETVTTLRHSLGTLEHNSDRQQQVEDQLTQIYAIARKHHVETEELPQILTSLKQQLTTVQNVTSNLEKTKNKVQTLEKEYLTAANTLTTQRQTAAAKLQQLITAKMQLLGMIGGKFAINIVPNQQTTFGAYGLERIEFLVSANPGQSLQPLNKVASGGELSRISLAIQVITAEKEVTPTLIFDEIDAGIGGKTADIVGQLLRQLSRKTQVICITHLPQIASQAKHQILVNKTTNTSTKTTTISLTTLNKQERVQEIARMLGGTKITAQTLAHAKEMLDTPITK